MASKQVGATQHVLSYKPQLDGLRFFAVLFVVAYHWLPSISTISVSYFFGHAINFFFVLSSYLITSGLFSAKEKNSSLGIPKKELMRVFLLRRTIRIFPAYYTFLVVVMLVPKAGTYVRDNAGMFFSYLANYQMFNGNSWPPVTAHIWTLAVEEQFYLLWPLVIFFTPQRHLLKLFISIIIGSIVAKAICYYPAHVVPQNILIQYCLEPFAIGGLLAYKAKMTDGGWRVIKKYVNLFLYAALPFGIAIIVMQSFYFSFVLNGLLFSIVSMKIIEGAIIGYENHFGEFLQNDVVIYVGRISYGADSHLQCIKLILSKFSRA